MKTLRNAGIATVAGLVLLVIFTLTIVMIVSSKAENESAINNTLKTIFSPLGLIVGGLVSIFLLFLIFSGFIGLGKKFDNKFLVVVSWAFFILLVLNIIYSTFSISLKQNPLAKSSIDGTFEVVFLLLSSAMTIMLGVSLLLFKNKIAFAKIGGILYLCTGVFFVSIILDFLGVYTYLLAIIIQSIMFFKASRTLHEK